MISSSSSSNYKPVNGTSSDAQPSFASSASHSIYSSDPSNPPVPRKANEDTLGNAFKQTVAPSNISNATRGLTAVAGIAALFAAGYKAGTMTPEEFDINKQYILENAEALLKQARDIGLDASQVLLALNTIPQMLHTLGLKQLNPNNLVTMETRFKTVMWNLDLTLGRAMQLAGIGLSASGVNDQVNGTSEPVTAAIKTIAGLAINGAGTFLTNFNYNKRNWLFAKGDKSILEENARLAIKNAIDDTNDSLKLTIENDRTNSSNNTI